ncbi:MAG TPA: beta-eliminating lyase-related protein [Herpetosiphonaceae bacterium]|nr:beta-eliminating lyase-related protein [Herpetosiphonaceae bacterium]
MDEREIERIYSGCTRFLSGHGPMTPRQVFEQLAAETDPSVQSDRYGGGELLAGFESEVAALLGKPAAVFMPSGTMCQPIALRIWADRRQSRNVAFHPTCHLHLHEADAYQLLHGLHGIRVGSSKCLMTLADLEGVAERLAALLLELPQREIGGQLPSWEELVAMTGWAREREIPLHLDGARVWECVPFYRRTLAEIAALFDTVYVSFYKTLGGIAGAVLAGPEDVIADARVWQHRHGGRVVRLFPLVLSAQHALRTRRDRVGAYHARAIELSAALTALPGIAIRPNPPHTNMMHLFLRGDGERLAAAARDVAETRGTWLFASPRPTDLLDYQMVELMVGDATLELDTAEVVALVNEVLQRAAA